MGGAHAQSAPQVPTLDGRVVDRANVLAPVTEHALEQELARYEREHGHQVVVHTTPSLEGFPIEDYSMAVAEQWKIGHKGLDNGVILTIAPNERKVRIEVGYGLEGVIPDAIAHRIVQDEILPEFRAGRMEAGIVAGTQRVLEAARGEYAPPRPDRRRPARRVNLGSLVWILLIFFAFGSRGFFFLPFVLGGGHHRGGFGGGSGGFGGGGFSGGGGGFGGGGSSGSW